MEADYADKDHEIQQGKNPPWLVAQHGHEALEEWRLFGLRSEYTFTGVSERHKQQHYADHAVQHHGQREAKLLVASAEQVDQWQGEHAGGDDADLAADVTEGVDSDAFLRVGGEVRQDGGYRSGDGHGHEVHKNVGDVHVDHPQRPAEVRDGESHDADHREGKGEPQEPWTHLAPLGMGLVNERADDRTCDRIKKTNH